MIRYLNRLINYLDIYTAKLNQNSHRAVLVNLLFHRIFEVSQIEDVNYFTHEKVTMPKLHEIVQIFEENNASFVSVHDIENNRLKNGLNVHVTFDDGYFDNAKAFEFLHRKGIPPTLFVCGENSLRQSLFWWDALNRGAVRTNLNVVEKKNIYRSLFGLEKRDRDKQLKNRFGSDVLDAQNSIHRPFTPNELHEVVAKFGVNVASHTFGHTAVSAFQSGGALKEDLENNYNFLSQFDSFSYRSFSFPNGIVDIRALEILCSLNYNFLYSVLPSNAKITPSCFTSLNILGRHTLYGDQSGNQQVSLAIGGRPLSRYMRAKFGSSRIRNDENAIW